MMNVYRQELKMLRGSFIVWTAAALALATLYIAVYPAFAKDADSLQQVFANLPAAAKSALGAGLFDMFTFVGFFANVSFVFMLAFAIQAMNIGISMTNREALARTTDFLLTKPLTRSRIFGQKLLASLTVLFATSGIFIMYFFAGGKIVGAEPFDHKVFFMVYGVLVGLQLWFLSVGVVVAQLRRRVRSVISLSLGIVLALFVLGLFGSMADDKLMRYVTPFKYIDLIKVIQHAQYETPYVVLWAAIVLLSLGVGWLLYRKRDVPAQV